MYFKLSIPPILGRSFPTKGPSFNHPFRGPHYDLPRFLSNAEEYAQKTKLELEEVHNIANEAIKLNEAAAEALEEDDGNFFTGLMGSCPKMPILSWLPQMSCTSS